MRQAFIWDHLLKKKASGIDDCDLGQVQEVKADLIITKRGVLDKKRYYLPRNLIVGIDGKTVYLRIMKAEALQFQRNN